MSRTKYLKSFIDYRYFDFPEKFIKSKITAIKFRYVNHRINLVNPYIFLCNKTTEFDRFLISTTLKGNFVFLKDSVIQKIYNGLLSEEETENLLKSFKVLKSAFISVVIFPEKSITAFGKTGELPTEITDFLFKTNYDFKFFSFVGTYFSMPIWAEEFRRCDTRFNQQFHISHKDLVGLKQADVNFAFNSYMPSSATTYSYKYNPYILSNKKAQNIETLIYCCPNCKKFFSLYSEFNCLKCRECGTAVEFSMNGTILLSSNITDLDSFADFQYNVLKNLYFSDKKPMIEYNTIKVLKMITELTSEYMGLANIKIYCNKFVIDYPSKTETYKLIDIKDVNYLPRNTLSILMKNGVSIMISGDNKENFYIIKDLHKFFNEEIKD